MSKPLRKVGFCAFFPRYAGCADASPTGGKSTRWRCCKIDTGPRQLVRRPALAVASFSSLNLSNGADRQSCVCRSTTVALRSRLVKGKISMKLDFRQRLLTTTLLVGAAALATPAQAQTTPPPTDAPPTDVQANPSGPSAAQPTPSTSATGEPVKSAQDIVITGTRIPQPNLTSAAPVTVVTNQDVKLTGTTRVEDLLNQLPSVGASQASGVSNGSNGTATVDLRYLGAKRSLTLVNGRRLTPGDPNSTAQAGDLNIIPAALIKRVEVLTGGASSVYGADAVAGVVNFIIDTNFTGVRFDGQYSFYQHNNKDFGLGVNCGAVQGSAGCAAVGAPERMNGILDARGYGYPRGSVADGGTFDG